MDIPPSIPPEWFDAYRGLFSSSRKISSAFSDPKSEAAFIPSPISTPFTAFIDIIAAAKSVSIFPYIGAPKPAGAFLATTSIMAPTES